MTPIAGPPTNGSPDIAASPSPRLQPHQLHDDGRQDPSPTPSIPGHESSPPSPRATNFIREMTSKKSRLCARKWRGGELWFIRLFLRWQAREYDGRGDGDRRRRRRRPPRSCSPSTRRHAVSLRSAWEGTQSLHLWSSGIVPLCRCMIRVGAVVPDR